MKVKITFLMIAFITSVTFAQQNNVEWQKRYGGSDWDVFCSMDLTHDGGYILTGKTESNDGDVHGLKGESDVWVVKLNSLGDTLWTKCYGGSKTRSIYTPPKDNEIAYSIQETFDYGYIVLGSSNSIDGDVHYNHSYGAVWLLKLNSNGDTLWTKCIDDTTQYFNVDTLIACTSVEAFSIQQTSDSGYIIAGEKQIEKFFIKNGVQVVCPTLDLWIEKLDMHGNTQWSKQINKTSYEKFDAIRQTTDNGYIAIGSVRLKNKVGDDCFVIKIDEQGNIVWEKQLLIDSCSINSFNLATDIIQMQGGYLLTGSLIYHGEINNPLHHGLYDMWAAKLNENGDIVWTKYFGGKSYDFSSSIIHTADNNYAIAGTSSSNDGDFFNNNPGYEIGIVKFDEDGNIIWTKVVDAPYSEISGGYPVSLRQDSEQNYIVAGSFFGDYADFFIAKIHDLSYDNMLTNINNSNDFSDQVISYPNPFKSITTIKFNNLRNEPYQLILTNNVGKIVRSIENIRSNAIEINRDNLPAGFYFLTLSGSKNYYSKLIIQ